MQCKARHHEARGNVFSLEFVYIVATILLCVEPATMYTNCRENTLSCLRMSCLTLHHLQCGSTLRYQNGYCGCGGNQRYHFGRCAMLKLVFVAPRFRLRQVQKNGKKEQNMKNRVLKNELFYFCVLTSWTSFWGSMRIGKIVWGKCACRKNFLTFCRQLRCEMLEISSYILAFSIIFRK